LPQKKARCDIIRSTSAGKGITNALLVAGIAHHESGLAQCWSEATWTCQGPWASDCGGPVLAGAADGPCSAQQGGIGMFQLDSGTHAQTLATYGSNVVNVAGNVAGGVDIIVYKVRHCPNTPQFGSNQEVVEFINSAKPGTANYETFITAMAWCYNGCAPSYTSCNHNAVRNAYKAGVEYLYSAFGESYWYSSWAPLPSANASSSKRVGRNPDGRLEVFARGTDQAVWHRWQLAPNNGFSEWSSLGGGFSGDPAVASNQDGRLEVFGIGTDGAVWHRWQLGDATWTDGWANLGGVGLVGEPAVSTNADGRIEIVARSWDGQLWQKFQTGPNSPFTESWFHAGTDTKSDPVLAKNADGRLELFVRGGDDALWHRWQLSPNGDWGGWSSLGGILVSEPAVGVNADGRLEVFHVGTDGDVYHRWQLGPGEWSEGWASLGGVGIAGEPAVATNADGRIEVVIRSWDGQLWQKFQTAPNSPFTEQWFHAGADTTSDPIFGTNADGRLELFVRGGDAALWHRWQVSPNGSWGSWVSLGGEIESF
jgi:acylphosphatase